MHWRANKYHSNITNNILPISLDADISSENSKKEVKEREIRMNCCNRHYFVSFKTRYNDVAKTYKREIKYLNVKLKSP